MISRSVLLVAGLACLLQGFHSSNAQMGDFLLKVASDEFTNSLDSILTDDDAVFDEIDNYIKAIDSQRDEHISEKVLAGIFENDWKIDNKTLECLIKHSDKVAAIISQTKQSAQKCIDTAKNEILVIKTKIEQLRDQLKKKIDEAKEIYVQCSKENPNNPSAILNCLYIKGAKVGEEIKQLMIALQKTVEAARPQLASIAERARRCIIAALEAGGKQIQQLIQDCLKEEN